MHSSSSNSNPFLKNPHLTSSSSSDLGEYLRITQEAIDACDQLKRAQRRKRTAHLQSSRKRPRQTNIKRARDERYDKFYKDFISGTAKMEEFVYRISSIQEWDELQKNGCVLGGDLDKSTGCFHLSNLDQVQPTLQRFFLNIEADLYLLQIDSKKLGDGLIYELTEDGNRFPHFYGPSRSSAPLPLDAVVKAEKLHKEEGKFCCSLLN